MQTGTHRHTMEDGTYLESFGPWNIPVRALVTCSDGKRRIARTAQSADTWFSLPARVSVKGKTVSGYVTSDSDADPQGYVFIAYTYGKNYTALPNNDPIKAY